jgi:sortase A
MKRLKQKERSARSDTYTFDECLRSQPKHRQYIYRICIELIHDFFVLLTAVIVMWVPVHWVWNARQETLAAIQAERDVMKWPREDIADRLKAAQDYNAMIAASGQNMIGEVQDPFKKNGEKEKTKSEEDATYQSVLSSPNGVMGSIRIPKVSIYLPIYHGTSDEVLDRGSGHLYGTSVPVGGKSTNTVLTGHRGLTDALLFTRLDELKKGDIIYITTLGHTLGYRVEDINVVEPEDTHLYKVVPGRDLLTLMTCTPYGVNTQRLVITAHRGKIPDNIPPLEDKANDALLYGILAATIVLVLGFILAMRKNYRELVPPPWHYDGTAIPKSLLLPRFVDERGLPPMGIVAHRKRARHQGSKRRQT